ncbi:MAG: hypothetical protein KF745_08505 [Phycisphaeraceae bacterium]|nr:hypothetical protein [Phycisphaeraceae bacterium]
MSRSAWLEGLWRRAAAVFAAVALLAAITAPAWHHHDHDEGDGHDEQSCAVCYAVHHLPTMTPRAEAPAVWPLQRIGTVVVVDARSAHRWVDLALRARGPPPGDA